MIRCILAGLMMTGLAVSGAAARIVKEKGTPRERAEQACYTDATTLCGEFVPDEAKITTCMGEKRAQLSPACRKVFDQGL